MSNLHMSLSIPTTPQSLSSAKALSGGPLLSQSLWLTTKLSQFSLTTPTSMPYKTTPIRMGGGPRTYPGGVSKWQWKRMQAKKAKQLLKARLARERQIYEMRKRAELKAAVSELERPWETVEKPPNLFSVSADEQLKVLADRFQKPGGLDLWSERDGPELFRPDNGLPSARFFPKGVVHSIKPYRTTEKMDSTSEEFESFALDEYSKPRQVSEDVGKMELRGNGYRRNSRSSQSGSNNGGNVSGLELRSSRGVAKDGESPNLERKLRKKGSRRAYSSDSEGMSSGDARFYNRNDRRSRGAGDISGEFRRTYSSDSKGMNSGNARFYDRHDRRSGGAGNTSGEFRKTYSSDSEGISSGNARSYNRNDRRSRGAGNNSGEFRRTYSSDSEGMNSGNARFYNRNDRRGRGARDISGEFRGSNSYKKGQDLNSEVFDMSLQNNGSYEFELEN